MPQLARDDATIHYEVEGQGPPVLLIQGVGVIGAGWRPQIEGLRERYSLCAFDNRGIGRSTTRSRPTSVAQMASDALALLDELGWARAHVVGHSMGGLIAQQLGRATAEQIGRARYLELADSSHGVTIQRAEQINAILDEHFQAAGH